MCREMKSFFARRFKNGHNFGKCEGLTDEGGVAGGSGGSGHEISSEPSLAGRNTVKEDGFTLPR